MRVRRSQMKKSLFFSAGVVLILLAFSFSHPGNAFSAAAPIVVKLAAMAPRDMPVMLGVEAWGKEIEKRTNGQVKFEFYWSQALVKAGDELKATGAGIADASIDLASYHPSDTPFATISELGFVTSRVDAPARALGDLYREFPAFREQFEKHNVRMMSFIPFPPTTLGSTKPIKTLEDLKGKKIRALGLLNEVLAKLGATPVAIPSPEIYESLSRNVIDGFTGIPLSAVKGFKFHEVTKNFLDFGYGNYLTEWVIFNKNKWDALPPDVRQTIEKVNAETIDLCIDLYAKEEGKFVAPLKEANCTFYTLPSSEAARWKNAVVPAIWNDWAEKNKKYGASQEFLNKYLELVKKYEGRSKYVNPAPK